MWLAGSHIFIDSQQINGFYDAVVGPAFRTVEARISAGRTGSWRNRPASGWALDCLPCSLAEAGC